jgi:elongation factor G
MSNALQSVRNVAFVGHPSSGKTSIVDALAFALGVVPRKGSVADKTSICDTEPEEQEKGHTLQSAVVQATQGKCSWTLIDTPGYADFAADTISATWAADTVVGVVSAAGKVTHNLRKKLELAGSLGRARIIVVTHLDADNTSFEKTLQDLVKFVGPTCVPVFEPDGSGSKFTRLVKIWTDANNPWRRQVMDRVMDACGDDEALFARYLETETLTDEDLHEKLPLAIAHGALIPVLPVQPLSGVGIPELIEFLREYGPNPGLFDELDLAGAKLGHESGGALSATVFNVKSDPHLGKVFLAKVHTGTLTGTDTILGPKTPERGEKLGGLFRLVGKKRESVDSAGPGEIVGFAKIESLHYGESFTRVGGVLHQVKLPEQPEPMVALAVAPRSRADEQKIGEALHKLEAEDPTFKVHVDSATHEMVAHGLSELHLQVMETRLKRRYGVEITSHLPKIAYRETVTRSAEGHYRHKKQTGGRGQFGECFVRVKPNPKGAGVTFTDGIVGGSIPRNLIPAVEKGMREVVGKGVLTDSQVVDLDFEVYDGKYHDVDSDEASFKIAGARAFTDAFQKAHPILLEPVMELVVYVSTDHAGAIFSDLTSHRRGQVVDQWNEADGALTVIKAHAPLATLMTYQRDLKSQTAGEGSFQMKLADYAAVPAAEQAKILAQIGKKHAHEE